MEIVEFLKARLDEDATRAAAARGQGDGRWHHETGYHSGRVEDERGETVVFDEGAPTEEEAAHIAAWDPARVLAEIDAKRELIDWVLRWPLRPHKPSSVDGILERLALPYADRPGFREAWRL